MSETTDEAIDLTDNVKEAGNVDQEAPSDGKSKWESIEQVAETVEKLADTGVDIEAEVVECTIDDPATPATSEISDISKSATNSGRVTPASQSDVASVSSSEKSTPSRKRRSADLSGRQIEFDNMSTSSGSVKVTKFPARVGIQWRKGERLEAMDFMQKWFPAKIKDINDEDMEILIHFDGWNQRYDEWVSMTSEKIRPMTRHSARKNSSRKPKTEFKVGERVLAKWTDCKMYEAKVTAVFPNETVEVIFYDGFKKLIQPINLRPMPPELKNQTFEVTSPPDDVLKKAKLKLDCTETQEKEISTFTTSNLNITSPIDGDTPLAVPSNIKEEVVEKSVEKIPVASTSQKKPRPKDPRHRKKMLVAGSIFARPSVSEAENMQLTSDLTPTVKQEPVSTQTDYLDERVKLEIPDDSETMMDPAAGGELDIGSFVEGGYIMPIPKKAFVIESDHNQYKCPFQNCGKGFRKKNLLDYHIKYYHVNGGKPPEPPPAKKRRKTIATCSMDLQQPVPHIKKPSSKKKRHASESGSRSARKKRHVSDSVIANVKKPEASLGAEVPAVEIGEELKIEQEIKKEELTPEVMDTDEKQELSEGKQETSLSISHEEVIEAVQEDVKPVVDMETLKSEWRRDSKHRRSESQDTTMTEESTDAEDYLKPDELVNCICGYYEENGLMIQCEVCMCWQHASCFGITDRTLPKVYVCYVCENPPGVRESRKYVHEQDWFKNGDLGSFNYLNVPPPSEERCNSIKSAHSLVADVNQLNRVLHALKLQLKILRTKDEKHLKQWHIDWDMVESLDESLETNQSLDAAEASNLTEDKEGNSDGPSKVENFQENLPDSLERTHETGSDANDGIPKVVNSETGLATEASGIGNEKQFLEETASINQDGAIKTNGEQGDENEKGDASEVNREVTFNHSSETDTAGINTAAGPSSENSTAGEQNGDQPPAKLASSNGQDIEVGSKMENMTIPTPAIISLVTDEDPNHSDSTESALPEEDPIETCERNLVQHILRIQAEVSRRMDLIEEQINVLEALEPSYSGPFDHAIHPDLTKTKKHIKIMDQDLGKVKRMAVFH